MKQYKSIWVVGSLICLGGEVIRKIAMLTAKKSFHHIVSFGQDTPDRKSMELSDFRFNSNSRQTTN